MRLILAILLMALLHMPVYAEEPAQAGNSNELHKWIAFVQGKIYGNWRTPPSVPASYDCSVKVKLNENGEIISAELVDSCGHELLEKSFLHAIWKSSPLPMPDNPKVIENGIIFKFAPR